MSGGRTPFGTRAFGNHGLVIDPGTLSPALYLSGLPNDGLTAAAGSLVTWKDKISGTNFSPTVGSSGISVFNDGSQGEIPGVWSASICGGSFFRGFNNAALASFPNTNGYTQYILVGGISANNYGMSVFRWPSGANGMNWVEQAPGFDGGGGNFWAGHPVAPGNIALTGTAGALDTGIASPTSQNVYDLWTLVSDGASKTAIYRNGVPGPILGNGATGLGTNLTFGGPSAGTSFVCALMSSYLLYTAQHTPGQIAGVRRWFRQNYGV